MSAASSARMHSTSHRCVVPSTALGCVRIGNSSSARGSAKKHSATNLKRWCAKNDVEPQMCASPRLWDFALTAHLRSARADHALRRSARAPMRLDQSLGARRHCAFAFLSGREQPAGVGRGTRRARSRQLLVVQRHHTARSPAEGVRDARLRSAVGAGQDTGPQPPAAVWGTCVVSAPVTWQRALPPSKHNNSDS